MLENTARNQRSRGSFQAAQRLSSILSPKCRHLTKTQAPWEGETLSLTPREEARKLAGPSPKQEPEKRQTDLEGLPL